MNFKNVSCYLWNSLFSFEYNCIVQLLFRSDLPWYIPYSNVEQLRANFASLGVKYNMPINIFG